jgi:rubrerythrin
MADGLTMKEVLETAIDKEIEARELYRNLSQQVDNDAAKDMLMTLSGVEKKHEELLRDYRDGKLEGGLHAEHLVDYKIAEHFKTPPITPDMSLDQVMLLAAQREKKSYDLYTGLAAEHPAGNIHDLFTELADQELDHKHRVEDFYNEVAFPQTSGG